MPLRRDAGAPAVAAGTKVAPATLFAAIALSIVAAAAPITLMLLPDLRGLIAPPRIGDVLLGLLLVAPAAAGLATALSGLGRGLRPLGAASQASEYAVLRILV